MADDWVPALIGGVLIGLSSLLAAAATGKIPGISGVLARCFTCQKGDTAWRIVFLLGLIAGAALAFNSVDSSTPFQPVGSLALYSAAGLLVGLGSRIGGGCTSGHGVCGMGLGARDSIIATFTFMAAGVITVWLVRHGISV